MNICREFMTTLGLLFGCLLAALAYFTYETIFGYMTVCSEWDSFMPLTLFLTCFYMASLCFFRNSCFSILRKKQQRNARPARIVLETLLLQENKESVCNCLCHRSPNEPSHINSSRLHSAPASIPSHKTITMSESSEISEQTGSISSLDSSAGGISVPTTQVETSKLHCISETSNQKPKPPDNRNRTSSKRQRYTETKWTREATEIIMLPLSDCTFTHTADERSEKLVLDKFSVHTVDEKLVAAKQEEIQNPASQKSELQSAKTIVVKSDYHASPSNICKQQLEKRSTALADYEKHVEKHTQFLKSERAIKTLNEKLNISSRKSLCFNQPLTRERKHPREFRKPPQAYHERRPIREVSNTRTNVLDNHDLVLSGSARLQGRKHFALTNNEKPVDLSQKKQLKSVHERTDEVLKGSTEKEPFLKKNDQSVIHDKNQQPAQKIGEKVPRKLKIESQQSFTRTQARNRLAESSTDLEKAVDLFLHTRYVPGISRPTLENQGRPLTTEKIEHIRKTLLKKFEGSFSFLNQIQGDKISKFPSTLHSTNNARNFILEDRIKFIRSGEKPRSFDNINLIRGNSFPFKNQITNAKRKFEQTEATGTTRSNNLSQINNSYDRIRRQELEAINTENIRNQHRFFPLQRSRAKELFPRIQTEMEEKMDVKLQMNKTVSEPGPSSSNSLEQDTERVSLFKPIMKESHKECFRRLKFECLEKKLEQIGPINVQHNSRRPAAFESKQKNEAKIKITDTDTTEHDISTKPSEEIRTKDTYGNKHTTEAHASIKPSEEIETTDMNGNKNTTEASTSIKPTEEIETTDMSGNENTTEANTSIKPTEEIETTDMSGNKSTTKANISMESTKLETTEKPDVEIDNVAPLSKY